MTSPDENLQTEKKVVVVFDICSSTALLEDLLRTENGRRWRNLLIGMKKFLVQEQESTPFDIYKFIGDGWILLFDPQKIKGEQLLLLLEGLCHEYDRLYKKHIIRVLETSHPTGLTFGADKGSLTRVTMTNRPEYIGRAINIACRLQGSIGQRDKQPAGKMLISKTAFESLRLLQSSRYEIGPAIRKL